MHSLLLGVIGSIIKNMTKGICNSIQIWYPISKSIPSPKGRIKTNCSLNRSFFNNTSKETHLKQPICIIAKHRWTLAFASFFCLVLRKYESWNFYQFSFNFKLNKCNCSRPLLFAVVTSHKYTVNSKIADNKEPLFGSLHFPFLPSMRNILTENRGNCLQIKFCTQFKDQR